MSFFILNYFFYYTYVDDIVRFYISFAMLGTVAEGAPVIPISAQLKYNIEVSQLSLLYAIHIYVQIG